jgi:hypothetical protein
MFCKSPCITSALKARPLSLWRLLGRLTQGIILVTRILITSLAFSVLQVKASTHPIIVAQATVSN